MISRGSSGRKKERTPSIKAKGTSVRRDLPACSKPFRHDGSEKERGREGGSWRRKVGGGIMWGERGGKERDREGVNNVMYARKRVDSRQGGQLDLRGR